MKDVDYFKPASLAEALELKRGLGEGAVFLAGGTDVMVRSRQNKIAPQALISLRGIAELRGARLEGESLLLGAATTLSGILADPLIAQHLPVLTDAARVMGSTQMRNVATVGGNVMSAAPSGDTLCPLLCLEAVCHLVSPEGARQVPMHEMFLGPRRTAARPGEVLTHLAIPLPTAGGQASAGAFLKLSRRAALDLALINLAAQLWLNPDGTRIEKARLAAGVVGPTPLRLTEAEEALTGALPTAASLERAAQGLGNSCSIRDSHRCAAWYREEMLRVLLLRAGALALQRLGLSLEVAA
ncbi:MAG: FAD binding domain-containing protein [Desulfarculus sp.]|nr:FAD binding domain-containing protein [Desulfarculus sp.]